MLTKFDELTCHQAVSTFDHPESSDKAWTEKLWCNVHDRSGKLVLATGIGVYPNRDVIDGFGCVNIENGRQVNVRVSRTLRPNLEDLTIGPLSWQVIEPYRRIQVAMGENKQGLSYELELVAALEPAEEEPHFQRDHGRVVVNACRYAQMGRARGWVKVGGTRYPIDEKDFLAQRDHSWGIRMGVGGPDPGVKVQDIAPYAGMIIDWFTLQFDDFGFTGYLIEMEDGRIARLTGRVVPRLGSGRPSIPIVGIEHDWQFHERSLRTRSGTLVLTAADKTRYELKLRELTTLYLRGGGYAGLGDYFHGNYMGEDWEAGESWDVTDPKVANEAHGLDDTVMEVRWGDKLGYGIVENMVIPPFKRYLPTLPPGR